MTRIGSQYGMFLQRMSGHAVNQIGCTGRVADIVLDENLLLWMDVWIYFCGVHLATDMQQLLLRGLSFVASDIYNFAPDRAEFTNSFRESILK